MIITVGREFGSGGRELGKRLADELGIPCYDKEIISEVAKLNDISPEQVERISETDISRVYAGTIGHSFGATFFIDDSAIRVISSTQEVIKKLAAQGDCVFVGRCADIILSDLKPLRIFVYADIKHRISRCIARSEKGESERSIAAGLKRMDKDRAAFRRLYTNKEWGKKESYDIMVNTSHLEVKTLIPGLAAFVRTRFAKE